MKEISKSCRWCGGSNLTRLAYAAKAPWTTSNSVSQSDFSEFVECLNCGLKYFTESFKSDELDRMYSDYRGKSYLERRQHWEPWYTEKVNKAIGHSSTTLVNRKEHLSNMLTAEIDRNTITSPTRVLDFGGDEGQFIPELISITERAVLEISAVRTITNVQKFSGWDEVPSFKPDFIMMCHVLEHTIDARKLVEEAFYMLPVTGLLYIEVPLDSPPRIPHIFSQHFYSRWTEYIRRGRRRWMICDLLGLLSKRFLGVLIPGSVIKQSEHVNYFSERAILDVCESIGFHFISSSTYLASKDVPILKVNALGIIFKK